MKNFIEAQKEIIELADSVDACQPQVDRAEKAKDIDELIEVVKENITWCYNNKMLTTPILIEIFGAELLAKHFIFIEGVHDLTENPDANIVTLGSSQATVKTWGSSKATVKTLDSSQATVETWDSSQATVETWGSSQATVKTWGSSQATVKTWDSSQATVKTWGSKPIIYEVKGGLLQDRDKKVILIKKSDYSIQVVE